MTFDRLPERHDELMASYNEVKESEGWGLEVE